jgi:transcriptional regulator of arginine metabolism
VSKNYRQGQILKLVRSKEIYTQEELAQELKAVGIVATQVTLSRDLRDLRLVKTQEGYQEIAADETIPQLQALVRDFLRDARAAQNLVVLKTDPGYASPIAVALDNEGWDEVLGTIAGDDTVLVVASDTATAEQVRQKFLEILDQ